MPSRKFAYKRATKAETSRRPFWSGRSDTFRRGSSVRSRATKSRPERHSAPVHLPMPADIIVPLTSFSPISDRSLRKHQARPIAFPLQVRIIFDEIQMPKPPRCPWRQLVICVAHLEIPVERTTLQPQNRDQHANGRSIRSSAELSRWWIRFGL